MSTVTGNSADLTKKMYNSIKGMIAPDPPSGPNRQCVVLKTGSTIVPDDYTGSDGKANLAKLFDNFPKIGTTWEASGSTVSTLWKELVDTGKAKPAAPPSAQEEKDYEEAIKKLYGSKEAYDDGNKSDFYKSVDKARNDVTMKVFALFKLKAQIQAQLGKSATQSDYDEAYQELAPIYEQAVQTAQQELDNRLRAVNKYETAIFRYNTLSLESLIAMFSSRMTSYKREDPEKHDFYEVYASPPNWANYFKKDYTPDDGWITVTINQNYSTTSSSDDSYKHLGGGGFIFTYSTSDSKEVSTSMEHDEDVQISFKVKTVDISRPWIDMSLLDYDGITLAGAHKGQWSDGKLAVSNTGSFTLLPTAMILAADVSITATSFSSQSKEVFEKISSSPGGLLRAFWFSNNTSVHRSKSASWNRDSRTLTVAGVQILGYSCALVPLFPKSSSK